MRPVAAAALLLFTAFFSTPVHADSVEGPVEQSNESLSKSLSLSHEVERIFEAKCVECHDSAIGRPRGDFGYIRDLARVAKNRDWVIPGYAEKSELYLMVLNEEMPGDESSVPPLTAQEKTIVKQWIKTGAMVARSADQAGFDTISASSRRPNLTSDQRFIRFLGQFHPPSSHFPIALLIAAFPAELMWKRTRKASWKATVRFCVMAAAASAAATAGLGWCNAGFSNYTGASAGLLTWHRWLGTGTALWAILTAVISEIAHKEGQPRFLRYWFRVILSVGIVLVSVSGYLGASLIYGIHHFTW